MTGQPRLLDGNASLFVRGAGAAGPGIRRPRPRQHVCAETLDGPDRPDVTRRHAVGTRCRRLEAGCPEWVTATVKALAVSRCRVNARCDERVDPGVGALSGRGRGTSSTILADERRFFHATNQ